MTFLVFSILQKFSTGYSFLESGFPSKICIKILSWIIKTNQSRSTSSLLLSLFCLPSHSLLFWRLLRLRLFLSFLLLHTDFLLWLCFFFFCFTLAFFFDFGLSFFCSALAFFFGFWSRLGIKMNTLKRDFHIFWSMGKTKKVMYLPLIIQLL